jgi:hypothetical protein
MNGEKNDDYQKQTDHRNGEPAGKFGELKRLFGDYEPALLQMRGANCACPRLRFTAGKTRGCRDLL